MKSKDRIRRALLLKENLLKTNKNLEKFTKGKKHNSKKKLHINSWEMYLLIHYIIITKSVTPLAYPKSKLKKKAILRLLSGMQD